MFGRVKSNTKVKDNVGSWDRYPRFVTADRVAKGVEFWRKNRYSATIRHIGYLG